MLHQLNLQLQKQLNRSKLKKQKLQTQQDHYDLHFSFSSFITPLHSAILTPKRIHHKKPNITNCIRLIFSLLINIFAYRRIRIKQRILSHNLVNYEDIIPYRLPPAKKYTTKRSFKKIYKPKGIIALYYYYKHLLGLYPKYNQSFRLTPEMRAGIRKMDMYSEQNRFMCNFSIYLNKYSLLIIYYLGIMME